MRKLGRCRLRQLRPPLERIERLQPRLNAFITVAEDAARQPGSL
jgi:hypothetical protein